MTRTPATARHLVLSDRGSATVWTVGAIMALLVTLMFVLYDAGVVETRHRAEAAADLAALGAAERAASGGPAACARARWLTDQMRVTLASCRVRGWDSYIEVKAQLPADLRRFGVVHARARAGPAHAGQAAEPPVSPSRQPNAPTGS